MLHDDDDGDDDDDEGQADDDDVEEVDDETRAAAFVRRAREPAARCSHEATNLQPGSQHRQTTPELAYGFCVHRHIAGAEAT